MTIDELPDEVIDQILTHCPQRVLHMLLKSKTVAHLAYPILYKNVILDDRPLELNQIENHYTDRFESDPFTPSRYDTFFTNEEELYPVEYEPSWVFYSAKELLWFYKTHPLYQPHTLSYCKNSLLETLKPSFLNRFRYLSYRGEGQRITRDKFVVDVSEFSHKVFYMPKSCTSQQMPKHIEALIKPVCEHSEPMGSVKYIGHTGDKDEIIRYDKFPKLEALTLRDLHRRDLSGLVDTSTLRCLTSLKMKFYYYFGLYSDVVDLSNLNNLKTVSVAFGEESFKVGYCGNCEFRIPQTLENLYLKNVSNLDHVLVSEGKSLKKLVVSAQAIDSVTPNIVFPPDLVELSVTGVGLRFVGQVFPKTIEKLTLHVDAVRSPVLPPKVKFLNFGTSFVAGIDLSKLVYLSTLMLSSLDTVLPPYKEFTL